MWQTLQAAIRHEEKINGPILLVEGVSKDEGYVSKSMEVPKV
jgi:hypothetical protein